jgi:O-acetyl-ADP-ribose deacetylase (regulator of RNase III)
MGYRPVENIEDCVTKIIERAESDDPVLKDCKSVLIPLLGSGTGQGELAVTAEKLVMRAISYLESHPAGRIRSVYFLTWTRSHFEILQEGAREIRQGQGLFLRACYEARAGHLTFSSYWL